MRFFQLQFQCCQHVQRRWPNVVQISPVVSSWHVAFLTFAQKAQHCFWRWLFWFLWWFWNIDKYLKRSFVTRLFHVYMWQRSDIAHVTHLTNVQMQQIRHVFFRVWGTFCFFTCAWGNFKLRISHWMGALWRPIVLAFEATSLWQLVLSSSLVQRQGSLCCR